MLGLKLDRWLFPAAFEGAGQRSQLLRATDQRGSLAGTRDQHAFVRAGQLLHVMCQQLDQLRDARPRHGADRQRPQRQCHPGEVELGCDAEQVCVREARSFALLPHRLQP